METAEITIPRTYAEALAAWQLQRVLNAAIQEEFEAKFQGLQQQLDWLRRQVFGQKSERRIPPPPVEQLSLGQGFSAGEAPPAPSHTVAAHTRRASRRPEDRAESLAFFDESRVPTETILLPAPEAEGLDPSAYEIIDTKISYRLAQRPGSYVVLKYERPVIKLRTSETLHTAPAPVGVLEGSRADVSLLAGVLVDKFLYHLPLYRQHQRMVAQGLRVSRSWLTELVQRAILLLSPIYRAQFESIRHSRVLTMDETPIKAGRSGPSICTWLCREGHQNDGSAIRKSDPPTLSFCKYPSSANRSFFTAVLRAIIPSTPLQSGLPLFYQAPRHLEWVRRYDCSMVGAVS